MAIGKAEKCLAGCRVTKHSFDKCLLTAWVFWIVKTGWTCCIRALHLGNRIMGACFQAPHATPGQRQMETFYTEHSFLLMGGDATQFIFFF